MQNKLIRVALRGNPGNVIFMYLAALKLSRILGIDLIANVKIDMFGIACPDVATSGLRAAHVPLSTEISTRGLLAFEAMRLLNEKSDVQLFQIEGYCQNVGNLLSRNEFDYERIFPSPGTTMGGRDDELIISIRGGEILKAIHPDYTLLPADFYEHLIENRGLKPVFFGQIADNPYTADLRRRFPAAEFRDGTSPSDDFDFLRNSKNLVLSVSSFAWLAGWLSNATQVIVPLTGLFHPNQHKASYFMVENDPRFEYYLFPHNYAVDVDLFSEASRAIEGRWRRISGQNAVLMFSGPPRVPRRIHRYLEAFDAASYTGLYIDQVENRRVYGDSAVFDHYLETGFNAGRDPCRLDRAWYCRTYPQAATEIGQNDYFDEVHHFVEVGREMGYLPMPS